MGQRTLASADGVRAFVNVSMGNAGIPRSLPHYGPQDPNLEMSVFQEEDTTLFPWGL